MTPREVFNKVKTHLLTQNARASDFFAACAYRGRQGRKCAVGCLITDEAYTSEIEGDVCTAPRVIDALEKSGVPVTEDVVDMLARLQGVHDAIDPIGWPGALERIEKELFGGSNG